METEKDEQLYPLRIADDTEGERCVSVDDLIDWLLSITDDGEKYNHETYAFADFLVQKLIGLKQIKL